MPVISGIEMSLTMTSNGVAVTRSVASLPLDAVSTVTPWRARAAPYARMIAGSSSTRRTRSSSRSGIALPSASIEHLADLARQRTRRQRLLEIRHARVHDAVVQDRIVRVAGHEQH